MKQLLKTIITPLLMALFMVVLLGSCNDEDNSIVGQCPEILSTIPLNGASGVPLDQVISATFNEPMNPATFSQGSISLSSGAPSGRVNADVTGTVSYDTATNTVSFVPDEILNPKIIYTANVSAGEKDAMGNALQAPYVWSFSTGVSVSPTVITTSPQNLATNVIVNKIVSATFSEVMTPATLNNSSFLLKTGTTDIAGTVTYSGSTARFTSTSDLIANTTYTATITTEAQNSTGVSMAVDYVWSFNTGTTTAPQIISTIPEDLDTNIPLNQVISATFNESIDPLTITSSSFTLFLGTSQVAGNVNYSGNTATFTPNSNLLSGNTYTATITALAKNINGVALENDYVWSFNTSNPLGPMVVNLNTLENYGIIAGVGVSNQAGPSEIHDMNVGIYPGARSSITGFFVVDGGPGLIFNGLFNAADDGGAINAELNQAQLELVQAYDDAAGATFPAPSVAPADLGGQTLAPGIYTSASTLLLQNGDLTLDAQGDENAVWIFQVGSGFTSVGGAGGNVILSGGAKAKNVFWQVSSSAIIGDGTIFKGNILSFSSITMNTGAVAEGRMLARNGSVVLTSTNIITRPSN